MTDRFGDRPDTPETEPAPTITSKARTADWVVRDGRSEEFQREPRAPWTNLQEPSAAPRASGSTTAAKAPRNRGGARRMVRLIPDSEPAPTLGADGLAKGRDVWVQRERSGERAEEGFDPAEMPAQSLTSKARSWTVHRPAPTVVTSRRSKDGLLVGRQMAEGEGENVGGWGYERPSTTIAGDSRVFQPGGHHEPGKQSQNAVRVSEQEASVLQGFPADYPWQGSRTKRFEQIGNAVPPPFARAIIAALLGIAGEAAA